MKQGFKKVMMVFLAVTMMIGLTGCGQKESSGDVFKVAIIKQMDHASLDEIANAIASQLEEIGKQNTIEVEYEIFSGQGDSSTLTQIGTQCIADGYDVLVPIATMAAQTIAVCAAESETPVIYAAISDPEGAGLTEISYVSGVSDALNTEFIMAMMEAQNPAMQKVGLLYSLSETNSKKPIEQAKAYLDSKNISYVEKTGNTTEEIISAASVLVSEGVEVIFTPTDNIVMAAELSIADSLVQNNIAHYTGADSFVRNGAFITCGVNYTDLGKESANLAYKAYSEGMSGLEDYYLMDGGIITVNTDVADSLGIDYTAVFKDMGEIVEVQTTKE